MRKFLKNNLMEIFPTIYEAHKIIGNYLKEKDFENAKAVLVDCQNSAVQLGRIIENSEGKGFITAGILEEYCKLVYEIFISISDESNSIEIKEKLDEKLDDVRKSVENDIRVKLEIVFMPYKASMWDSLESVWKAADEDPDCDAYVVPIPYYDRNPDRSFGQCHYEGLEFPEYVPVTHFNKYSIAQRKPDVIYIHNPYDDCNYVTSVDPRFYSRELKKHTDCLVYIPYFFRGESVGVPNDLEVISNFVRTPGVMNADKVIVQSEYMKQAYVKNISKYNKDNLNDSNDLSGKILGLGSPKIDKLINVDKDEIAIPDKWKKFIYKSDGTKKKIIFYNVGISSLLKGNEKWLNNIINTLNIFRERIDDMVLLWRPHPLILTTIESMRPQFVDKYKKIVNDYVIDGWGIYDDTSDLYRAIALSDAFYGDESSVLNCFCVMGKKVYLRYIDTNQYSELISWNGFFSRLLFVINGKLHIKDRKDYFYKVGEKCSFEYSCKSIDSSDEWDKFNSYFMQNDKIYFLPNNDIRIVSYDFQKNKTDYITLDLLKCYCCYKNLGHPEYPEYFSGGLFYNNKIFLIPFQYQAIVAYDLQSKQTIHCVDLRGKFGITKFCSWTWMNENTILLPNKNSNEVIEFNLDSYEIEVHKIGKQKSKYLYIHKYDNNVFLVDADFNIVCWNCIDKKAKIFMLPFKNKINKRYTICNNSYWMGSTLMCNMIQNNIISYNNKMIFMDFSEDIVFEFDCQSCKFDRLDAFDKLVSNNDSVNSELPFSTASCIEKDIVFFVWKDKIVYSYNIESKKLCKLYEIELEISKEQISDLNNEFLSYIISAANVEPQLFEPCGQKIHECIKENLIT